ncbi:MAG TPA: hybrid sensor histidine kinase/response regulator [Polyangia bacterium]|nr:hybrid sensor histidine kinase/response regulator [Polyangia bacterium]
MSKPLKVLFVEDSTDDRDLLLLELRRGGFDARWRQVATADALSEALEEAWDLILCDYHMPGFSGPAALSIVSERGLDIPFIMVSGVLGEEAAVTAMKAGAHDFFPKNKTARLGAAIERELAEAQVRKGRREAEAEKERLFKELQRALRVRDDFLVLASHEFRTPLTVLRLQVDALARSRKAAANGDGKESRRLDNLDRQLERLSQMIERLLDVTMLSNEPLRVVPAPTDLRKLLLDVIERSSDWIADARCTVRAEPVETVVGAWDAIRLESIITNLLSNALKYGAGKQVDVSLRQNDGHAVLAVHDRGIGMSQEAQSHLFQKFGRAVPTRNYGGLGMGLWIVDQLVRAHGGTVKVRSSEGEGATFTVQLPLTPRASVDTSPSASASAGVTSTETLS